MMQVAFQDRYPDGYAHCFGCGRLNEQGYQLKSYWLGEETVCTFLPPVYYSGGFPGIVYGGLIASLIDCHAAATAAAGKARELGDESVDSPLPRFVTASLTVNYVAPTPTGIPLEIRASIREISGRKVFVDASVSADGKVTATGSALMVQIADGGN
jgi:acyl-coenzyme A thioesterase PaaI-like protein